MNIRTKQYCVDRVHMIAKRKIAEIREKYTSPKVMLSEDEKVDLIYSASPPPMVGIDVAKSGRYIYLTDAFKWYSYETPERKDNGKIAEESKLVKDKATFLIDELMLGDSKEALAMIRKFEA